MSNAIRAEELSGISEIFGYKIHDKEEFPEVSGRLVTIYVGDDDWWHPKFTIHEKWLTDMQLVAGLAKQRLSLKREI